MAANKDIPVTLHPSLPMDQLVAYINQNFQTVANQLNTYIVSDGTDNRIVLGRLPDGSYGLVITKEGYSVEEVVR